MKSTILPCVTHSSPHDPWLMEAVQFWIPSRNTTRCLVSWYSTQQGFINEDWIFDKTTTPVARYLRVKLAVLQQGVVCSENGTISEPFTRPNLALPHKSLITATTLRAHRNRNISASAMSTSPKDVKVTLKEGRMSIQEVATSRNVHKSQCSPFVDQ